jgi:hypothetical protein
MGRRALATRESIEAALLQVRETDGWHTVHYRRGTLHGLERVRAITKGCPYRVRSLLILVLSTEGARIPRGEVDDAAATLGMRPKGAMPAPDSSRLRPTAARHRMGSGGSKRSSSRSDGGRVDTARNAALLARLESLERHVGQLLGPAAGSLGHAPPYAGLEAAKAELHRPPPPERPEAELPGQGSSPGSAGPAAGDGDRVFRLMRASRDARREPHDADDG